MSNKYNHHTTKILDSVRIWGILAHGWHAYAFMQAFSWMLFEDFGLSKYVSIHCAMCTFDAVLLNILAL